MSKNMELWNKVKRPPKEALKQIKGGRLSGMTDISPQWRYMALTEIFGPCGVGWKYEIVKLWTEPASEGQITAFAMVNVCIKGDGEWSQPIPGIGGSMLVAKEKSGLHTSDEAYKMAVTDALSVALKMLGVAADIYLNNLDGSKYRTPAEKKIVANAKVGAESFRKGEAAVENKVPHTGKVASWIASGAKEILAGRSSADYWTENKVQIKKDCGENGAKEVYKMVVK